MSLTPERAWEIWEAECIPERSTRDLITAYSRAIEAEVLRISGLDHSADAGKMMSPGISAAEYARQCREVPERAAAMDSARERLGFAPRATGCPDTMDDTARFAADELPAILREQAS
jgi:hypothetical protein